MNKTIRTIIASFCLFLLVSLSQSPSAAAHILKEDNGIVAVLHVQPNDVPTAKTPTQLLLFLSKNVGGFQINDYKIKLQLNENGKQLQQVAVTPAYFGAADEGTATVTFPKVDVYQVVVTGTSINSGSPSFKTTYELRVASVAPGAANHSQIVLGGLTVALLLGLVAIKVVITKRQGKKEKEHVS